MRILIIGGTRFLGRNLVERALELGHDLTLFNRGKTSPALFPEIEKLKGDRDGDLAPLKGRTWDVVVDTCGYIPRIVAKSAKLLAGSVELYVFISTINVYADYSKPGLDENSPLATIKNESVEEVTGETYGPLKVLCEKVVREIFHRQSLILRCGLIVGPHDPTDRFTYWPVRVQSGGEILVPSPPHMQVQFIDVRDLADFLLLLAERRTSGIFNTTGPADKLTMQDFLTKCSSEIGSQTSLTWVSEAFITGNDVGHIPMWTSENWRGIFQADCSRAIHTGLSFRLLKETINDTLAWHATRPGDYELKVGLNPEKEKELLKKWHDSVRE